MLLDNEHGIFNHPDNTGMIGPFPGGMPPKYPTRLGAYLGGMGDMLTASDATGGSIIDPATVTAANSELVFLTNWYRGLNGEAPLNVASSAPAVNIGITPQVQSMLIIGGIAAFVLLGMKGKRGKKRR